jgi:hypothetical protein
VNNAERSKGQQFNLGVDTFNVGQSNKENEINAQNLGAFETQKSQLISSLGDSAGEIGLEGSRKDIAKNLGLDYDQLGNYLKSDGTPKGKNAAMAKLLKLIG